MDDIEKILEEACRKSLFAYLDGPMAWEDAKGRMLFLLGKTAQSDSPPGLPGPLSEGIDTDPE